MRSAADLLDELNAVDESPRIEAKRASGLGKSAMETVIAFANEPALGGGYLLLGVDWAVNEKGDTVYRAVGLPDPDKVQRDLASQCASMLNVALRPEMQLEQVEGRTVLVVYVAEADVTHKPVYKKATGLPNGAYRRVGSSDQRCVDEDLWVLRGESQPSHGPDYSILPDARLDDFDSTAIAAYRRDRARINPQAEELAYGDEDMLEALGALRRVDGVLQPTLAGIVLFGKSLALRRLLPMVRIDYIRLPEGQLQSVQEPILPRKVIREALANAAMHRNYTVHSPTQIIRYSNRIEIRNVGYSLKEPAQLGMPGSRLRNPIIAAVLHDLHLAEAKGTGIRAMRRLAANAGLPLPDFHSDRQANEFKLTLFLHNLLTEEDHIWLRNYAGRALSSDETKVLIYVRATGAVDNTACRDLCGFDTLAASLVLRRLRDRGLLVKQGAGSRTYYTLAGNEPHPDFETQPELPLDTSANSKLVGQTHADQAEAVGDQVTCNPKLATLPPDLATLQVRASRVALREGISRLCGWAPQSGDQLATLLGKDRDYLRNKHLTPMVRSGELRFLHPESAKHPHQAYVSGTVNPKDGKHET